MFVSANIVIKSFYLLLSRQHVIEGGILFEDNMQCPYCSNEVIAYKYIFRNHKRVVTLRCSSCKKCPDNKQTFISLRFYNNWQSLPLWKNNSDGYDTPCAVESCKNEGTEYHHFAPRHLFQNYHEWPGCYLCVEHHTEWHKSTKTGIYYS